MKELQSSRSFLAIPALLCLIVCVVALLLIGCSLKVTSVDFGQDAESDGSATAGTPGSSGPAVNILVIKADNSRLETKTEQDSKGELAGAMEGATAATDAIKDALSNYAPDLSKRDSENTTDTSVKPISPAAPQTDTDADTEPEAVKQVSPGADTTSEDIDFKHKATYTSYGVRNGGRQAWRIPKKGPAFGKKIKVVFSDGHTVYVGDTSHNYRENDGFVFKPGLGPNGEGPANTGTAHGGVYLHAPYGNKSTRVTFYY